jgi:chromosome segregation ATPase
MSKFLMGALVVLTMGVFSSCKDYDDDINANTALINGLQSQVSALESAKSTLQADLSKANSAIQAAQAAADKAAADLAQAKIDLQNAINAAKTELNGNIDAAKKAAIDEAQARIDAAEGRIKAYALEVAQNEAAAAAAAAKIEMLNQLNNEVATLNAAINTKLSTEEFNTILATLATKEGLNEALKPVLAEISALQNKDSLYSKVLGTMLAPITGLAVVLGQIVEQKGGSLESAEPAAEEAAAE